MNVGFIIATAAKNVKNQLLKVTAPKIKGLKRVGDDFFAGDEMVLGLASDAGVESELAAEMNNENAGNNWNALFDCIQNIAQ